MGWKWGGEQSWRWKVIKKSETHSGLESRRDCLVYLERLGAPSPIHQPLCFGPWRLEGLWEGREAQKDSGWLKPEGHWPRSGWTPRKKRHRGDVGLEASKLGYVLSTALSAVHLSTKHNSTSTDTDTGQKRSNVAPATSSPLLPPRQPTS